jgi:hypothetical protein
MVLENVKSVSVVDNDFVYLRNNGWYNVIQHESIDGKDYSYTITEFVHDTAWEMFEADVEEGIVEESDNLPEYYRTYAFTLFEEMCEDYNIEIK